MSSSNSRLKSSIGYLLACDFDGTAANTFEQSPNSLSVPVVHELTVRDIFGSKGYSVYVNELGGLKNRPPSELVALILTNGGQELVDKAREFFEEYGLKPEGGSVSKDIPLKWNSESTVDIITELFVARKLHYFQDEIGARFPDGSIWPRPCKGFMEFWEKSQELKAEGIDLTTAVISSGHKDFIDKTFRVWDVKPPDILVTEDEIRPKVYPKEIDRRVKPGQFPLALAHREWLVRQGLNGQNFRVDLARTSRDKIIYFGDDPNKDGRMAGGRVLFGLFDEKGVGENKIPNSFVFRDWKDMAKMLESGKDRFDGRPIREIFLQGLRGIESENPAGREGFNLSGRSTHKERV